MRAFPFCRPVAAVLAAALLLEAPGLGSYAAAGQVVTAPRAGVSVPVLGQAGAASLQSPALLAPAGATPTLPSVLPVLPTVTPSVSARPAAASAAAAVAAPAAAAVLQPAAQAAVPAAPTAIYEEVAAARTAEALGLSETAAAPAPAAAAAPLATTARAIAAAPSAGFSSLRRLFDGALTRAGLAEAVPASAGAARVPALNAARPQEPAPEAGVPAPRPAPEAAKETPYALSLIAAGLGAGAAALLIPTIVPFLGGVLPFAAPAFALKTGVVAAGFALGASLGEGGLWRSFPGEVASGAVSAGRTAFRFWARFGRVFNAVLTASSIDEAMKADLPANILRYPVLAMPFVLVGYAFAPALFVFGAAFKAVEVPARAAWRGVKRIVVGLLPFMADVFAFLGRAIRRFFPAVGSALYRGGRMILITAAGGAVTLAAPAWNGLVRGPYAVEEVWDAKLSQFPAGVAMLLGRALGLVASAALGAVGAVAGFAAGLPLTVTDALLGFAAKVAPDGAIARADARWRAALDKAADLEAFHRVTPAAGWKDETTLPRGFARLSASVPGAAYALPFSIAGTLGLWAVGVGALFGYERKAAAPAPAPAVRETERETPPAEDITGSPWAPLALGLLGAAAGAYLIPGGIALSWLGAAAIAAGGALGLALSQPRAWFGIFGTAYAQAAAAGRDAFRQWARLGVAARVNVTGQPVDEALFAEAPAALTRYPLIAWPAVIAGYPAAAVGFVLGGASAAVGVPVQAAWRGLVILLTSGLIRRILRGIKNVLVHGLPFVFGFAVGGVWTELKSAGMTGLALALPTWRSVVGSEGENPYRHTGLTGLVLKRLVQALGLVVGLASGLFGLAVGAVAFLPAALTAGLRQGLDWGNAKGRVPAWLERWQKDFDSDMSDASGNRLAMVLAPGTRDEAGLWQGVLRAANGAVYALSSVLWGLPVALAIYFRAVANASRSAEPVRESWKEPNLEKSDRGRPQGFFGTVAREAGDGWKGAVGFWDEAGAAHAYAMFRHGWSSILGDPYRLPGGLMGAFGFLTGAVAGGVEVPGRAFLSAVKRLALRILPFLRKVWDLAYRIARRVVPFLVGAVAGALGGAAGSALFGALLLGRPWFKYVTAEDYDTSTTGKFLGVAALRVLSVAAGTVFGVVGLAFGLLAALPYSLTFMVATAFGWGGIGGKSELFFSHWKRGALPAEMRRVNKLTDSFDFSEQRKDGELSPMDGWVRLGMIAAATLAATLAATVAGFVAYARSILAAARATREGKPVPDGGYEDGAVVGRTAWKGASAGAKAGGWLAELAGVGAAIGAFFGLVSLAGLGWFWTNLGYLGLLVLAGPAGWVAGGVLGLVLGGFVGTLRWLDRLLSRPGPEARRG